ncbi:MAG: hypothetical protein ACLGI6_01985 [Gammaproteobacteria bacterium]
MKSSADVFSRQGRGDVARLAPAPRGGALQQVADASARVARQATVAGRIASGQARVRQRKRADGAVVQLITQEALLARAREIQSLATRAPAAGSAHLWRARKGSMDLTLLGTIHGVQTIEEINFGPQLVGWLEQQTFNHVYMETAGEVPRYSDLTGLKDELTQVAARKTRPAPSRVQALREQQADSTAARRKFGYDEMMAGLAAKGAAPRALETQEERNAHEAERLKRKGSGGSDRSPSLEQVEQDRRDFFEGRERAGWLSYAAQVLHAEDDAANVEARNDQWVASVDGNEDYDNSRVLWIVGAAHLPGLISILLSKDWTVEPIGVFPSVDASEEERKETVSNASAVTTVENDSMD